MSPWNTNSPLPTEEELAIRNNAISALRKEKILYKATEIIRDFLKEKGMTNASINIDIFPEFVEGAHKYGEWFIGSGKGYLYGLGSDLHINT
jgi:hypothetical protein